MSEEPTQLTGWARIEVARLRKDARAALWADMPDKALGLLMILIRETARITWPQMDPVEAYSTARLLYETGYLLLRRNDQGYYLVASEPLEASTKRPIWGSKGLCRPPGKSYDRGA